MLQECAFFNFVIPNYISYDRTINISTTKLNGNCKHLDSGNVQHSSSPWRRLKQMPYIIQYIERKTIYQHVVWIIQYPVFLSRLYKVYGELSYSPRLRHRRPRPDFIIPFHFLRNQLQPSNICSLSSTMSDVWRFITLALIFSDLSPLELRIFLKIYYFLQLLLYFLKD
jgi:hypothetical protein